MKQWLQNKAETILTKKINWINSHNYGKEINIKNKTICFKIQPIPTTISLNFGQQITVKIDDPAVTDLTIITSFKGLKKIKQNIDITDLIKNEDLIIQGDVNLLQELNIWLQHLDIDWLEPVESILGGAMTYQIHQVANGILQILIKIKEAKAEQWLNFIKYEINRNQRK